MKISSFRYVICTIFIPLVLLQAQPQKINQTLVSQQQRLAREYEQLGDFDQALNIYRQLYQANPDNYIAFSGIQRILISQKRYDEMIQLLQSRLEFRYDMRIHADLGSIYFMNDNRKEAYRIWNEIIDKNEKNASAYQFVARGMLENRLIDEAIEIYLKARKKTRDDEIFNIELANLYAARNDYKKATGEYLDYLEKHPTQFNFIKSTISRFINEDKETADLVITMLIEQIKESPRQANLRTLLMDVYLGTDQYEPAFEQVIYLDEIESKKDKNKEQGKILYDFGNNALSDENFTFAERAFEMVLEKYPESVFVSQAKFGLARSYQLQGNYGQALQVYQELIAANKRSFQAQEALFQIGEVKLSKQFDPAGARTAYENILKYYRRGDKYYEAVYKIGECYFAEGNLTLAREWFNRPLKEKELPATAKISALYYLAELDIVDGQLAAARTKLEELLDLKNANIKEQELTLVNDALEWLLLLEENSSDSASLAMYTKTILLEKERRYEKGISILDSLIAAYPDAPIISSAWIQKARFYEYQENYQQAIASYRKIIADHGESFYVDLAKMKIGDVYTYHLNDPTQGMREYEEFLVEYPQSIYLEDVRRKIRLLERNL